MERVDWETLGLIMKKDEQYLYDGRDVYTNDGVKVIENPGLEADDFQDQGFDVISVSKEYIINQRQAKF